MPATRRPRLLFAAYMAGGIRTLLDNLQHQIAGSDAVDSEWVRVEMDAESQKLGHERRRALLPGTVRNSLVTGREIRRLEAADRPFDAAWFYPLTICMLLERFRRRVPYVLSLDGTPLWLAKNELWYALPRFDPQSLVARFKHRLTRRVFTQAFHLLPFSYTVRDSLIEDYGIPPERITVTPPGIDLRTYVAPDRASRPERPGLNVLFVGYDFARKGGDLLAAVAGEPEFRDFRFDFVTRTYEGPAAANIRVFDDVGTNSPRLVSLYREADVFALPTRADTYSISGLEAMAMGLPVITTAVGGVGDVVREGETGYLLQKDDLPGLRDRLRRLRDDRERRLALGHAGRERVERHFDGRTIAGRVVDLLIRAATSRR